MTKPVGPANVPKDVPPPPPPPPPGDTTPPPPPPVRQPPSIAIVDAATPPPALADIDDPRIKATASALFKSGVSLQISNDDGDLVGGVQVPICTSCGALIGDVTAHLKFHRRLDNRWQRSGA